MEKSKKEKIRLLRERSQARRSATLIIESCRAGVLDINSPTAIAATQVLGFDEALNLLTKTEQRSDGQFNHADALNHRVGGSFGMGKKR